MQGRMKRSIQYIVILVGLIGISASCTKPASVPETPPLILAEFTESFVAVSIQLEQGEGANARLAAIFTPTESDAQLYSFDLPKGGMDGLGRPTLLELPADALMKVTGELESDVAASMGEAGEGVPALPMYPAGPVILRLPVSLPEAEGAPVTDHVIVTYMSCTPRGCHKPVVDKRVEVRLPAQ